MSKYGVISGPYFLVFGLNTESYSLNLRIQSKCRKIWSTFHAVMKYKLFLDPFSPVIKRLKKHKKITLNDHISKTMTNSESKLRFKSSFNLLQNSVIFLPTPPTWVHGRGLRLLQFPAPLPVAHRAQRINDVPGKILNLLFLVYFFWK